MNRIVTDKSFAAIARLTLICVLTVGLPIDAGADDVSDAAKAAWRAMDSGSNDPKHLKAIYPEGMKCFDRDGDEKDSMKCSTTTDILEAYFSIQNYIESCRLAAKSGASAGKANDCLDGYERRLANARDLEKRLRGLGESAEEFLADNLSKRYPEIRKSSSSIIDQIKSARSDFASSAESSAKSEKQNRNSKTCRQSELAQEICDTLSQQGALKTLMSHEQEVTRHSGVVNKRARYQIAANQIIWSDSAKKLFAKYQTETSKTFDASSQCQKIAVTHTLYEDHDGKRVLIGDIKIRVMKAEEDRRIACGEKKKIAIKAPDEELDLSKPVEPGLVVLTDSE